MSQTDENLKIAFADESQTNIEYLAYAHQAMDEGFMEIAQLFREAAGAEVVHGLSHLKAMGIVRTTRENLVEAAEGGEPGNHFHVSQVYRGSGEGGQKRCR